MFGLLIGFAAMATAAFLGQNQKELSQTEVKGPLTLDFNRWLKEHRYGRYNFPRLDLGEAGSYGGKLNKVDQINQYPVIFIMATLTGLGQRHPLWHRLD
ncbi:hypothetical protein L596_020674 [Steinernema carpocapsae]|uniref:Uncharacterized protein n=1 Tax=Steinernema carpocapsae TaxID=34508 RepID=A0A4U5MU87_STECR|nr:hypothetical protein L596_020674 [Steinernema carpocapsae]